MRKEVRGERLAAGRLGKSRVQSEGRTRREKMSNEGAQMED